MRFAKKGAPAAPRADTPVCPPHRRGLGASYWWLLSATGTSGLGNGLVLVAFPLLAVTLTRQPVEIAGVVVAGRLPWLVVSLPAGALADRIDRRRLVVAVEGVRAAVLAALGFVVLSGATTLPLLYLTAFIIGALETAFSAATSASLPALVRPTDLPKANGYMLAAETAGGQFAGPALGGLIFAVSPALPILGDALSFAGSAAMLVPALRPAHDVAPMSKLTLIGLIGDLRVGLRWFLQHSMIRRLAGVVATFAFCQSAVLSVMVLYGLHVLHLTTTGYGIFLALGATGDVAGSLLAQRAHRHLGPARAIVAAGTAAAAGYLILAATTNAAVALTGYTLEAVAVALGNVATVSLRQQLIPTELFGRVNNTFRTCVYGAIPAGALAGGILTAFVGLHATFLVAGLTQLFLIAVMAKRLSGEIARMAPQPG
jgi:MFS family permease